MTHSGFGKRCSCDGCSSIGRDSQFLQIDGRSQAGGQDWSELAGSVLCMACYVTFFTKGSLATAGEQPARERCSCEACEGQGGDDGDIRWAEGEGGCSNAGDRQQDLVELAGRLPSHDESPRDDNSEGGGYHSKSLAPSLRFCSYQGCRRPNDSSRFSRIDGRSEAGGQDWTWLAGSVLCAACYSQYKTRGTLERAGNRGDPLPPSARKCTYSLCKRPFESTRFHQIDGMSKSGGQVKSVLSSDFRGLGDRCRMLRRLHR